MARSRPSLPTRFFWWGAHLAVLYASYLLFVGEGLLNWVEYLAGAAIAALGFLAWLVVEEQPFARLMADGRVFAQGWRLVLYAFTGTWEVLTVLFKQLSGGRRADSLLRAVPFDPGGDDRRSATRRALAVAYTSITPNFIVLGVDCEAGRLLFHQIKRSEVLELTRRLGAGE